MLRPNRLQHYLSAMRGRGVDAFRVLAGTGLTPQDVDDPDALIGEDQCLTVVSNMLRLTGDPSIGFEMGRHARLADCGLAAQALASARTLRAAIEYSLEHDGLLGRVIPMQLRENTDRTWTIVFDEERRDSDLFKFCVEEWLVIGMKDGGAISGRPMQFEEVRLSYPAPSHAHVYGQTFGCPVHFDAAQTSITVKTPALDTLLPHNDARLNEIAVRQCSRHERRAAVPETTAARLRRTLKRHRASEFPSVEAVAREMGLSTRTLRRRLSSEGTSFRDVLGGLRLTLAEGYLEEGELTSKEIAWLLGFADTNAFRRAFKAWSGRTIGEYRSLLHGVDALPD